MSVRDVSVVLFACSFLAACSADEPEIAETQPEAPAETPIADSLKQPIDKAKEVEALAQDRKAQMDKELEEMEGNTSDDNP
ncbi:MAG: hypothetical protein AAF270_16140 [Pseudomonadota bacterium]